MYICGKNIMKEYRSYLVSDLGEVFNKFGKRMKPHIGNNGYLRIAIQVNGIREDILLHRLVADLYIPNPENKPEINHKNGVKTNCAVSNLERVTRLENQRHAIENEFIKQKGEDSANSKLTNIQAEYVRNSSKSINELANELNVHRGTISRVKLYKTYKVKI